MTATTTSFTMPKVTTSTKQPSTTECESTSSNTTIKIPTTTPIVTTEDSTRSTHSDIVNCSKESNFDYVVRDAETKTACILTSMSIRINLQYVMENYQTNRTTLIVPRSAKTTGQCGEKIDNMTLSWKESVKTDNDNKENVIVFYYGRDARFFLDFISIDVHLDSQNFPSAKQKRISANTTVKHLQLFSTLVKDGVFVCKVNTIINIGNQIDVVISDVRLIAFNQCSRNCRRTENNCVTDVTSVLIGAVVIGIDLLLILVVSFLTWRKKNIRFYAI
ncbi:lysosome-associated membrane glycoprotein 1-like isoform X2 [Pseudomyrmex gracilis]|nr:lysosome-associated membrane glycoprotein 1-like isoform X2 [Pseudomyrmex gracilis]